MAFYLPYKQPPQSTEYDQECVDYFHKYPHYVSDKILLQFLKLQAIAQEMKSVLPRDDNDSTPMASTMAIYIKTLQNKLERFQEGVPLELRENGKS